MDALLFVLSHAKFQGLQSVTFAIKSYVTPVAGNIIDNFVDSTTCRAWVGEEWLFADIFNTCASNSIGIL